MSVKTIDARGIPCPQPVILARNAMREADEVTVLVNAQDALANVRRLAEKGGWAVRVEEHGAEWTLHLSKGAAAQEPEITPDLAACTVPAARPRRTVLVVSCEGLGRGSEELAATLMRTFFHVLTESNTPPGTVAFLNSGVKLVVEGSPVLGDLQLLAAKGIEMLSCGVCLNHYQIKDKVAVGIVSNMYAIAEAMFAADQVVNL
jgi:selenium metabolism protein YedF